MMRVEPVYKAESSISVQIHIPSGDVNRPSQ